MGSQADANKQKNKSEKISGLLELASTPVRISMNMTGKCNIRCIYCHLTFADYYTKQELNEEGFSRLKPYLEQLSHLVFFSSTEPLMAEHFDGIFDYSAKFEAESYLSTNGILISKERAEAFVKNRLEFLTVSFGGLTRESFKQAHQVDRLDDVLKNLEYLNEVKRRTASKVPRLRLVFVTWKENAHELPDAVRLARELDCSEGLKITFLKAYDDNLIESIPFYHKSYVNQYVEEARALGKELGVKVDFDGGEMDESIDVEEERILHRKCFEPWERMHIEADGSVRTCPVPANTIVAGNINEQSLDEIWNGDVFRMFRERTNSDNPPDPCLRCTHNFHKNFAREDIWDQRDLDLGIYKRLGSRNYLKKGQKGSKKKSAQEWTETFMKRNGGS